MARSGTCHEEQVAEALSVLKSASLFLPLSRRLLRPPLQKGKENFGANWFGPETALDLTTSLRGDWLQRLYKLSTTGGGGGVDPSPFKRSRGGGGTGDGAKECYSKLWRLARAVLVVNNSYFLPKFKDGGLEKP